MAEETTEPKAPERAGSKLTWWQWVLMYPALAVALVGAVPQFTQWVSALRIGAPPGSNVADLKAQHEAWSRNYDCLGKIDRVKPASETTYAIDLLVCPSGDILITLTPIQNPKGQVLRWIQTREILTATAGFSLLATAHAGDPVPRATRVIAVTRNGDVIVRRVQLSDNTCEDQTIKSYTGQLVGTKPAPCAPF
jgi:nitrate reductase NapE component